MIWSSLSDFFSMGGYGLYVWGSVTMTLVIMIAEVIQLKQANKQLLDLSE